MSQLRVLLVLLVAAAARRPLPRRYGSAVLTAELDTGFDDVRRKLVLFHNYFRARVDPPASNMLHVTWSAAAAEDAQRWAEACQLLVHDNATGRWVDNYGSCGQNIFVANVRVPWLFAVKTWFRERRNFTFASDLNDLGVVGHYTQMVWHSSHELGCGFHHCNRSEPSFHNYVCNYCPMGNHPKRIGRPYDEGEPCSACADTCRFNKLCTNSCSFADLWSNCARLNATWHRWLCGGEHERFCRATCRCGPDTIK